MTIFATVAHKAAPLRSAPRSFWLWATVVVLLAVACVCAVVAAGILFGTVGVMVAVAVVAFFWASALLWALA